MGLSSRGILPITRKTFIDTGDIVALQGTLDTFALPDVLALLATAKKTGCLRLSGERGSGSVWVSDGTVSALEVPHAPQSSEPVAALFELLRFDHGEFSFEPEVAHGGPSLGQDVMTLLQAAEALLGEWREIQTVVPSMDVWVRLAKVLPGEEIMITQPRWDAIVAVASGATMHAVADTLELSEVAASRNIKELVELGILAVDPVAPVLVTPDAPEMVPALTLVTDPVPAPTLTADPVPAPTVPVAVQVPKAVARPARTVAPVLPESERFVPLEFPSLAPAQSYDPVEDELLDPAATFPGLRDSQGDSADPDDITRQLAQLSPQAAEAVRLATSDEAEADDVESEASEVSPGRGMLVKFLSSVKS